MKKIYKFGPVTSYLGTTVTGRIVHVGMQNDQIFVWAEQNTNESTEVCTVFYVGTGYNYSDDLQYVGSVFEGPFVWHVIKRNV